MRVHKFSFLFSLAIMFAFSLLKCDSANAQAPEGLQKLEIGQAAPDFTLPGIDDRDWSLADFAGSKVFMVYFTSNHCPVCHAHDPRLMELLKVLDGKDIKVVAINPNSGDGLREEELGFSHYSDSFEDMKPYAKDHGFTFPYLYDGETQKIAKAYGCLATPHVFLFDEQRKLRYQGHLDNSRFADPESVKRRPTRDAILALLNDKEVEIPNTKPFGCSTKWREKIGLVAKDNEKWAKAEVKLDDIDAAGIKALVANDTKKYRLFNVWSTTCEPCVEEFPGLVSVSRRMGLRDFELITISTDLPDDRKKALAFLDQQRAALPSKLAASLKSEGRTSNNYLYTDADMDALIEALDSQWKGPQPHTILVAPGGKVVFRHNGTISEKDLLAAVLEQMTTVYQPKK